MKYLLLFVLALIAGCASTDYENYAKSSAAASVARSQALAQIANSGDSAAKVAAVMALAMGAGETKLQAPAPNAALQWASILVPGLVQVYGIAENSKVAQTQSNNAASMALSTNSAFVGIAGKIQAAAANVSNVTTNTTTTTDRNDVTTTSYANPTNTTTTTLSGTGSLGSGTYSTTANPTTTTLSGTGTLGSGAYSTTDNHSVINSTPVITPIVQVVPTVITPVVQVVPVVTP